MQDKEKNKKQPGILETVHMVNEKEKKKNEEERLRLEKEEEIKKLTTTLECIRYGLSPGETMTYVGGRTQ